MISRFCHIRFITGRSTTTLPSPAPNSNPPCSRESRQVCQHYVFVTTDNQQLWPSSGSQSQSQSSTKDTSSPNLSPSASFSNLGGPSDQATPKASAQSNPFDLVSTSANLSRSTASLSLDNNKRSASPASFQNGLRTPTSHGFAPLPLSTPGAGQPTTSVTVGDTVGQQSGIGFGLHEPPKMRKAMQDGSKTPVAGSPPNQIQAQTQPPNKVDNGHSSNSQARGTLQVKLISARGLAVSHNPDSTSQPYVVMQFEQNEYVSRAPHPVASSASSVPFTQAQPQPVTPGNLTRSQSGLGVGTITRAFAEAVGRGKPKKEDDLQTPKTEEPSGGSWFGKPGPGDPVWKEEVNL